jgi:3-oxoacyl-[acyl-carrier protein] reductase
MSVTYTNGEIVYASYPDLEGKVAVVTGSSRGIGAATAVAMAHNGIAVAVTGRDKDAVCSVVDVITQKGGRAIGVLVDVSIESDLHALRDRVIEELGPVDILATFAGGNGMPIATNDEVSAHWREVIETDLTSVFLTISTFLPDMVAKHSGSIITMSSSAARQAAQSSAAYAAAKAGVIAFSRHLAGEYAREGIRVNCVAPSAIENDHMRLRLSEEQRRSLAAAFPLGRIGQSHDVAEAVLFLASSASSWITGMTLDISGGKVMI